MRRMAALMLAGTALAACANVAVDPAGPAAGRIAGLWWLLFWLGLAIYAGVMAVLFLALRRRRPSDGPATPRAQRRSGLLVWGGGVVVPLVVLLVLLVANGVVSARVPWNTDDGSAQVVVDVTGHQFWWEVRYPDPGFTTANEIVIPAGEPVLLRMTSSDVIHSFWVPELHGKIDLTPGHGTSLIVEADEPGNYRGQCAEFCGLAHARMALLVVAEPRDAYERWAADQAEPAAEAVTAEAREGREVFMSSSCVYCHTVRGHGTTSDVGPDLTHFASRRTIGAGTLPNTRGHLGGWVVDPQQLKPGNLMPGTQIDGPQLQALLDYLESLQ